ncbi:MAG TPA: hypothetical protein VGK74_13910 [Symbiobacteriaceae bacterium]|jgi:hypothetical protein
MPTAPVAIAAIGRTQPDWVRDLPPGTAEAHLVSPESFRTVEDGLNDVLARTRAPFFLPVQADDRLRPEGLAALVDTLRQAPPGAMGAVAPTDQVRRDGTLRPTPATAPVDRAMLLGLPRISTPVLMRTAALRAAGGWQPGEAAWERRAGRHRRLLARMLEGDGYLVASNEDLGVITRAEPFGSGVTTGAQTGAPTGTRSGTPAPADLRQVLARLLYLPVAITGAGGELNARGRLASLNGDLVTLATDAGGVMLIRLDEISAVETPGPTPDPRGAWPGRFRPQT